MVFILALQDFNENKYYEKKVEMSKILKIVIVASIFCSEEHFKYEFLSKVQE